MKLKKALSIAQSRGLSWVAVDKDEHIFMYYEEPHIGLTNIDWVDSCPLSLDGFFAGTYTGGKDWTETKRRVGA